MVTADKPENPDKAPVAPKVIVDNNVNVPVPDRLPLKLIGPVVLGSLPSGKLQPLLTVLVPPV
jgi:hypothetical protein